MALTPSPPTPLSGPQAAGAADPPPQTNTLALLLPHPTLFAPPILTLLRQHYEHYGPIAHWAPVRGFGRAIVVYEREEDAEMAKREGDWLRLDVGGSGEAAAGVDGVDKASPTELVLRLHYLPPTILNPDPATTHLAPPALPHNFLISPPGSPPEGWEPIAEDAPNTVILPEDLQRALESLELNGSGRRDDGREVIVDEGGVVVQVEDTEKTRLENEGENGDGDGDERMGEDRWERDMEEFLQGGGSGAWGLPSQANGAFTPGSGTPGWQIKIAPTAMPPIRSDTGQ
ncbi:hypothetical protein IAT38_008192 [Cryptococcus sp. DSM 104549]